MVLFLKKHSKDTNWRSKHKPVDFESTSSKDVLNPAIARAAVGRGQTGGELWTLLRPSLLVLVCWCAVTHGDVMNHASRC